VLFYLCWRLAPVLATVIVGTGMAAAVYRKVAKGIENKLSKSLSSLSRVAGQAFSNIRTVRAFAGAPPAATAATTALCPHLRVCRLQPLRPHTCLLQPPASQHLCHMLVALTAGYRCSCAQQGSTGSAWCSAQATQFVRFIESAAAGRRQLAAAG
jgi:hypothetical protein